MSEILRIEHLTKIYGNKKADIQIQLRIKF